MLSYIRRPERCGTHLDVSWTCTCLANSLTLARHSSTPVVHAVRRKVIKNIINCLATRITKFVGLVSCSRSSLLGSGAFEVLRHVGSHTIGWE